ncbi:MULTISPECIES: GntR family transcriptional regulator [unclassified Streptomyces]|uniref:GntR family transcriptional regulator n=1 Tax=unclassified Streptomyces TaxID=2593676 RepID=UPI0033E57164
MSNHRRTSPRYLQLARHIQERIDAGEFPAGSRLPSEPEMCAEFGVNRLTVREAIAELERAAAIEIRRGIGTFVRPPVARVSIAVDPRSQRFDMGSTHASLPESTAGPGMDVQETVTAALPAGTATVDEEAARHLGRPVGVLSRVETVFSIGSETWGISSYWMPSALLPRELAAPGPVENLVRALADSAGITLEYDWRAFSAVGADIGDADVLGVPAGSPLLVREGVSCTPDGEPVLYVRRRIQGERARFVLNFRESGTAPPSGPAGSASSAGSAGSASSVGSAGSNGSAGKEREPGKTQLP